MINVVKKNKLRKGNTEGLRMAFYVRQSKGGSLYKVIFGHTLAGSEEVSFKDSWGKDLENSK
jgi:hypothetical protein